MNKYNITYSYRDKYSLKLYEQKVNNMDLEEINSIISPLIIEHFNFRIHKLEVVDEAF